MKNVERRMNTFVLQKYILPLPIRYKNLEPQLAEQISKEFQGI